MFTPKEILDKVNGFIDGLTYNRKPETIYEPIKVCAFHRREAHSSGTDAACIQYVQG